MSELGSSGRFGDDCSGLLIWGEGVESRVFVREVAQLEVCQSLVSSYLALLRYPLQH